MGAYALKYTLLNPLCQSLSSEDGSEGWSTKVSIWSVPGACGMFGHRKENCHIERKDSPAVPECGGEGSGEGAQPVKTNYQIRKEEIRTNPEILEDFGPWMLAARRSRRIQNKPNGKGRDGKLKKKDPNKTTYKEHTSRYAALSTELIEDMENDKGEDLATCTEINNYMVDPTTSYPVCNKAKSPNVQTNERKVAHTRPPSKKPHGLTVYARESEIRSAQTSTLPRTTSASNARPNQAAPEREHGVVFGSGKSMETRREEVNHTQAQVTNITSNDVSLLFSEHHDDPRGDMEDKGMEDKGSKNHEPEEEPGNSPIDSKQDSCSDLEIANRVGHVANHIH